VTPFAWKTCKMNWDFQLAKAAQRAFRSMPARDRSRINGVLNEMKTEPLTGDIVALSGEYQGQHRRRVGSWRILFEVNFSTRVILVHDIRRSGSTTY
jgi:mRNA-degrading endonuclease RelE of RelBE toxin-antitoxin system